MPTITSPGGQKTVLTEHAIGEILSATVTPPPESLQAMGMMHWSARRPADWLPDQEGPGQQRLDQPAVVAVLLPIPGRCSAPSRSFVLAPLRALHLDHACAPAFRGQPRRTRNHQDQPYKSVHASRGLTPIPR